MGGAERKHHKRYSLHKFCNLLAVRFSCKSLPARGAQTLPKNLGGAPQNCRREKVDSKQVQYCGPILLGTNFQVEVFFLCCTNLEDGEVFFAAV